MLQNTTLPSQSNVLDNPWQTDAQVAHQLKDMKEQTSYMTEFRSALKYALEEVQTLRSDLAEEKTKGFDEISNHIQRSKLIEIQMASKSNSNIRPSPESKPELHFASENKEILQCCTETSSSKSDFVIAEASDRIERICAKVVQRNSLISKLRKQLQKSTSLLQKREDKLEQKLNHEKLLKSESDELIRDRDKQKLISQQATHQLNLTTTAMQEKETKVNTMQNKLDFMHEQIELLTSRLLEAEEHARYYKMQWSREREFSIYKHDECTQLRHCIDDMQNRMHQLTINQKTNLEYSPVTQQSSEHVRSTSNIGLTRRLCGPQTRLRFEDPGHVSSPPSYQRQKVSTRGYGHQHLSPIQEDFEEMKITKEPTTIDLESNAVSSDVSDNLPKADISNSVSLDASAYPYLVVDSGNNINFSHSRSNQQTVNQPEIHAVSNKAVIVQSDAGGSPSPCSSLLSTLDDSKLSDVTTYSGLSSDAKSKQSNRKKKHKSNRYIRYGGHKIDVTNFDMQDFRQIMWALSAEEQNVDTFLDFLATQCKRLQSDPSWRNKHTLGKEDDWLSLKGCY